MARFLGCVGPPLLFLVAPMPSVFVSVASSWPKTDYKNSPPRSFARRRRRNTKPRNRESEGYRRRRSEGGNAAGITSGGLHPPPACSSSTSTARSSPSPHCKLLANMMCGAIYYSLDLLCLPSVFEKWFVHGTCEIVRWLVAYKCCYLLWLSLCTIYECTHMLGNACKVITGNVMEWGRLGRTCKPETESWSYFIGGYI